MKTIKTSLWMPGLHQRWICMGCHENVDQAAGTVPPFHHHNRLWSQKARAWNIGSSNAMFWVAQPLILQAGNYQFFCSWKIGIAEKPIQQNELAKIPLNFLSKIKLVCGFSGVERNWNWNMNISFGRLPKRKNITHHKAMTGSGVPRRPWSDLGENTHGLSKTAPGLFKDVSEA